MSAVVAKKKSPVADGIYCRVRADGALVPADPFSASMLKTKKICHGEVVRIVPKRMVDERSYEQWKKAHGLGTVISYNIDEFEPFQLLNGKVDSHGAIKHLQFLSGVECEQTMVTLPDGTEILARQAHSLAFDLMGQERFDKAYKGFCAFLRSKWFEGMEQWQLDEMVRLVE